MEEQAYHDFARVFHGRFYRYFLTQNLPPFEAEDLTETLISDILIKLDKYKPREDGGFDSWVYQLMRHAAVDWHRRRKIDSDPIEDPAALPQLTSTSNPAVVSAVREALDRLDEQDRTIIELHDLGGETSYRETAALLGITPGAARVRRHRALRRLEQMLEGESRIPFRPQRESKAHVNENKENVS